MIFRYLFRLFFHPSLTVYSACIKWESLSLLNLHLTPVFDPRFPESESPFDDCEKDVRVHREPGRLPPLSHDLCQLPEAAWLLQHRDHERETVDCGSRGPAVFPPLLISHISHSNAFYSNWWNHDFLLSFFVITYIKAPCTAFLLEKAACKKN